MRIALICSNSGSGGLLKYIKGFLKTPTIHSVNLYCGNSISIEESRYIHVIRTDFVDETGIDLLLNRPLRSDLVSLIDEFSPDIVIFMNGWMRKGLEHYKCISILHNQLAINWRLLIQQRPMRLVGSMLAVRNAVMYSLKHADGMIFLSEASKKETDDAGHQYKSGKVILFGHEAQNCRDKEPLPCEMIYVSTQFPYKNHVRLLQALARVKGKHPDFHVSFVGCSKTAKLDKLVKEYNLSSNVSFCGWMSHEETLAVINKASIYLHPSMIESTSNGVLEGVIPGNTIVCSKLDVFYEAIEDRAYYFSSTSIEEMARAIDQAIKHPKPLSVSDCQKICQKYDRQESIDMVYAYAEELVNLEHSGEKAVLDRYERY